MKLKTDYQKIINAIYKQIKEEEDLGEIAKYIPELAKVDPNKFGVFLTTIENEEYGIGDCLEKFSIQSIAKVLSLTMAYQTLSGNIWERVGVEPSGNPFNSLVQLETDEGIPRNPFINGGALVICDMLLTQLKNPKQEFLQFIRDISGNPSIHYSEAIAKSEMSAGFRNIAVCNFIKSFGNIINDPNKVLDFYFHMCSIKMNCQELSQTFMFLANSKFRNVKNEPILNLSHAKRINAIMQTCGFYDESGEFSFKVGLPGKSGVGGGIVAVHPGEYTIAVWSPKLNKKGNSYRGMQFLELFTTKTESSIF
ncbi:MAG: glutaminase [Saprospiraceae bacterium]|nr:glutaminase [Saprospiraceae bacterium]NNL91840.1 glutaminase [Saprospiraceae bacterium]